MIASLFTFAVLTSTLAQVCTVPNEKWDDTYKINTNDVNPDWQSLGFTEISNNFYMIPQGNMAWADFPDKCDELCNQIPSCRGWKIHQKFESDGDWHCCHLVSDCEIGKTNSYSSDWTRSCCGPRPTVMPTMSPTMLGNTPRPTSEPTRQPTRNPSSSPTAEPTFDPTAEPTAKPTAQPTPEPTAQPTAQPTRKPTAMPSPQPTYTPTAEPTRPPRTPEPTRPWPTRAPTRAPSMSPTVVGETMRPTQAPTLVPTQSPFVGSLVSPPAEDDSTSILSNPLFWIPLILTLLALLAWIWWKFCRAKKPERLSEQPLNLTGFSGFQTFQAEDPELTIGQGNVAFAPLPAPPVIVEPGVMSDDESQNTKKVKAPVLPPAKPERAPTLKWRLKM